MIKLSFELEEKKIKKLLFDALCSKIDLNKSFTIDNFSINSLYKFKGDCVLVIDDDVPEPVAVPDPYDFTGKEDEIIPDIQETPNF